MTNSREALYNSGGYLISAYLQLSKSETTANADLAVILDSRASNNGPQLVNRTRSDSSSLSTACDSAADLLSGLFPIIIISHELLSIIPTMTTSHLVEVCPDPTLPILSEI